MATEHGHHRGHHGHAHTAAGDRRLVIAIGLILALMLGEVIAGIVANSLALISDAAHMLTDAAAIGVALVALRLARRPPHGAMTFGLRRVEVLAGQINGVTLLVLALLIGYEAVRRLITPPTVRPGIVLTVALVGAAVNLVVTWVLAGADRRSLGVEGGFRHLVTDLYAFIGTAVAAVVILATGFERADPIASLVVAGLMVRSGYAVLAASTRLFLEAAPADLDPDEIGHALAAAPGIVEVHDLHVWEVTSGFPALSAHVLVDPDSDCHEARRRLTALLAERFGIAHTTLQVDHAPVELLEIETAPAAPGAARRSVAQRHPNSA
jgi:cobalt-zinc-cadmium efflux system protein